MKKILALFLAALFLFSACGKQEGTPSSSLASQKDSSQITSSIVKNEAKENTFITPVAVSTKGKTAKSAADFSYELFKNSYVSGENVLISPASVIAPLIMASNGADGETLKAFEEVLGADKQTLNNFLSSYLKSLEGDKNLSLSQSVWANENFEIKKDFTDFVSKHFASEVYSAKMNSETANKINEWVDNKTDGEIDKIVDSIEANTAMLLVNATLFDAKWLEGYPQENLVQYPFWDKDQNKTLTQFMVSTEQKFISGEGFSGVIKPYENERYAFMALLPDYDSDIDTLISSISGSELISIFESASDEKVITYLPEFEVEYNTELSGTLANMGLATAFDVDKADFSLLCEDTYLDKVYHNTAIEVSKEGTKAAAATAVTVMKKSAHKKDDTKSIVFSSPFIYAIIDTEADMPAFIGAVNSIKN